MQPAPGSLPTDKLAAACAHCFRPGCDPFVLQYGTDEGARVFREALAAWLTRETGHGVSADECVATAGGRAIPPIACAPGAGKPLVSLPFVALRIPTHGARCNFVVEPPPPPNRENGSAHPTPAVHSQGVSHGLDVAIRRLSNPGDTILVEAPTYFLASGIFQQCGLMQVSCPAAACQAPAPLHRGRSRRSAHTSAPATHPAVSSRSPSPLTC